MKSFENPAPAGKDDKPKDSVPTRDGDFKITINMPKVPGKGDKPKDEVPTIDGDLKVTFKTPKAPGKVEKPADKVPIEDDRKVNWIPGKARARREPGNSLVEFEDTKKVLEAIASAFFEHYPFVKESFEKNPDMMRSFRAGLAVLMDSSLKKNKDITPAGLQHDEKFLQEVLKLSFKTEDEEKDSKRAAGRNAG